MGRVWGQIEAESNEWRYETDFGHHIVSVYFGFADAAAEARVQKKAWYSHLARLSRKDPKTGFRVQPRGAVQDTFLQAKDVPRRGVRHGLCKGQEITRF